VLLALKIDLESFSDGPHPASLDGCMIMAQIPPAAMLTLVTVTVGDTHFLQVVNKNDSSVTCASSVKSKKSLPSH